MTYGAWTCACPGGCFLPELNRGAFVSGLQSSKTVQLPGEPCSSRGPTGPSLRAGVPN